MAQRNRPDLITRAEAEDCSHIYGPDWHAPLPPLVPGMFVKIGIRTAEGDMEWPWGRVRRVLDQRIWVTVEETHPHFAEAHGVEDGDEIEVLPEEIHIARTPEYAEEVDKRQAQRAREAGRLLRSADELAREIDRHVRLDTSPARADLARWVERLEDLAKFHERLNPERSVPTPGQSSEAPKRLQ